MLMVGKSVCVGRGYVGSLYFEPKLAVNLNVV